MAGKDANEITYDSMTGLKDRVAFFADVRRSVAAGQGRHMVLVQLTQLMRINRKHGALVGDGLLRAIAGYLRAVDPAYSAYRIANCGLTLLGPEGDVAQMEELPEFIRRKARNYQLYKECLRDWEKGELLPFREGTKPNYWFYSLVLKEGVQSQEDVYRLVLQLQEAGVQTRPVWGLIHEQKPYRGCAAYEIERAVYYSRRIINLPCSTQLTEEELEYVAEAIKKICK